MLDTEKLKYFLNFISELFFASTLLNIKLFINNVIVNIAKLIYFLPETEVLGLFMLENNKKKLAYSELVNE